MLAIFDFFCSDHKWDKVQHECIKCLKAIMNNKVGLKDMFAHKEALTLMARSLNPNLPHVMVDAVKLMAAVCLVPPRGHEKTLEAITIAAEMKGAGSERFQPIVQVSSDLIQMTKSTKAKSVPSTFNIFGILTLDGVFQQLSSLLSLAWLSTDFGSQFNKPSNYSDYETTTKKNKQKNLK